MLNFEFFLPTKVYFGRGEEEKVGKRIADLGVRRVLFHYGKSSIRTSGLYQKIKKSLSDAGLTVLELGGVSANPVLSKVYEGIDICKRFNVELVLAVGGGSVIDSAKAIAAGAVYDGDVWDFFWPRPQKKVQKSLKVATVLTIPAAGSETSDSAVITKEDEMLKRSYHSDLSRPVFSILNPELAATLPPFQVACGVCDMMCHIMERYFTNVQNVELTDRLCEALLKTIIANGKKAVADPSDYEAMSEIMLAGSHAHNGLLDTGRIGDWASHGMSHEISSRYGAAHGEALAVVFPEWMRYVMAHDTPRFAMFAENVFGIKRNDENGKTLIYDPQAALLGIAALSNFWKSLGLKTHIREWGAKEADMLSLARKVAVDKATLTTGQFVKLNRDDILQIYQNAY